tara:strand:- start:155 stop:358 length:204 start_codon:yes stop_codon:yes gene_type:complete
MNLIFLSKTDKELDSMRDEQSHDGRLARKEITRRAKVGYADGTMFMTAKAAVETESRVGQITIVGAK